MELTSAPREYDSDFSGVKPRTRTSSGRRSRKQSTSSSLVRVLLEDKLDAERLASELNRANDLLRIESRRAQDAERVAREAQELLKGVEQARYAAQQEAARVKAELRLYKVQYESAQSRLMKANEMIREADLEREAAIEAMHRMRKKLDKYREAELERKAREEGRREGREEILRERAASMREEEEMPQMVDNVLHQPTPMQPSPSPPELSPTPHVVETIPGPVPVEIETPMTRDGPDHIVVRSPAPVPIPPPGYNFNERFPPPDRPLSRAATMNYPNQPPYHATGHARNYSVPNPNNYSPRSSSSDSPLPVPFRPISRTSAAAISSLHERDLELGNRTPGGLGLSGVPSVHTQTPGRRTPILTEPEIIVPRPPSHPSTPTHPITMAPSFEGYTRPNINSVSPSSSTSSTKSTSSTDTLTGQPEPAAQTPRVYNSRRPSTSTTGSNRRYSSSGSSSIPGITIEPPSRPDSTGTVMTTTTIPVFRHESMEPPSPGVIPSMIPPFDAQHISGTPGPSSRRVSIVGADNASIRSSGAEPPPGFMSTAPPMDTQSQRTPSLRHTPLNRPQSRISMASAHRRAPPPTIPEDGLPPGGSAAEYYQAAPGSPAMSGTSAWRVPLPPETTIGSESRPASRASRTVGHTPYRRPTSSLYE